MILWDILLNKIFKGTALERAFRRVWKKYSTRVDEILELCEKEYQGYSKEQLRAKTQEFRDIYKRKQLGAFVLLLRAMYSRKLFLDESDQLSETGKTVEQIIQTESETEIQELVAQLPANEYLIKRLLKKESGAEAALFVAGEQRFGDLLYPPQDLHRAALPGPSPRRSSALRARASWPGREDRVGQSSDFRPTRRPGSEGRVTRRAEARLPSRYGPD